MVYDPIDALAGNIKTLSFRDLFGSDLKVKITFLLSVIQQKITFKHSKNIICRDLQLANPKSMLPMVRRKKNVLLFSDYFLKKYRTNNKVFDNSVKIAVCGNMDLYDYGNGQAYYDCFKKLLDLGFEVSVYLPSIYTNKRQFIENNQAIKELLDSYSLFKIYFLIPNKVLIEELQKHDYGIFLNGEHYFKKYNDKSSIYDSFLFFRNSGARQTSLMEAGLTIILTNTKPRNYASFLVKRYGKFMSIDYKTKLIKKDFKKIKNKNILKFKKQYTLGSNINRLEKYYLNIMN